MNYRFTVFCSFPDTPRGEYDEEIDVDVDRRSETLARRAAEELIAAEYAEGLRPRRVVFRPGGWY